MHISILAFSLFACEEFHSEFQLREVSRNVPLTDKQVLHYFELPKLPEQINSEDELNLWLSLFDAETEEDLTKIEKMEVAVMKEAIGAYRQVTAANEFRELERQRERARHNEASALRHARVEGERRANEKWQGVVTDLRGTLLDKDRTLAEKDRTLAEKDRTLAEKEAIIAKLQAQLDNDTNK